MFTMQFYNPADGTKQHNPASGAYIFAPDIDDQSSHPYSKIERVEVNQGEIASSFTLYYNDQETNKVYTAFIRLVEGYETIEYEVQLNQIPIIDNKGIEVVAKWQVVDFDNQDTFYTDSNGLAMLERVKDQRPDFTLETGMLTSSNYYPINQAIAMRDTTKQM